MDTAVVPSSLLSAARAASSERKTCAACFEPITSKTSGFCCLHCHTEQCTTCADAWWTTVCEDNSLTGYPCMGCKKVRHARSCGAVQSAAQVVE